MTVISKYQLEKVIKQFSMIENLDRIAETRFEALKLLQEYRQYIEEKNPFRNYYALEVFIKKYDDKLEKIISSYAGK